MRSLPKLRVSAEHTWLNGVQGYLGRITGKDQYGLDISCYVGGRLGLRREAIQWARDLAWEIGADGERFPYGYRLVGPKQ